MEKIIMAIAGVGEMGSSLSEVLSPHYKIIHIDLNNDNFFNSLGYNEENKLDKVEVLNICFPFSDNFIQEVKGYQKKLEPKYTVIHSTVPVGTSRKCGAIHSPIVGIHPFLETSIRIFTKFLSGEKASEIADYFRRAGLKVYLFDRQETTFYALMIEYIKDLKRKCDEYGLNFSEVYTMPSQDYNKGYQELGYEEYKMPLLIPIMKEQGGHCTINNCDLWNTEFTKFIKKLNSQA